MTLQNIKYINKNLNNNDNGYLILGKKLKNDEFTNAIKDKIFEEVK